MCFADRPTALSVVVDLPCFRTLEVFGVGDPNFDVRESTRGMSCVERQVAFTLGSAPFGDFVTYLQYIATVTADAA